MSGPPPGVGRRGDHPRPPSLVVSVLMVGLSYGARNVTMYNVLSYARRMMQNSPAFRDSPIIPLRRSMRANAMREISWIDPSFASLSLSLSLSLRRLPCITFSTSISDRLTEWRFWSGRDFSPCYCGISIYRPNARRNRGKCDFQKKVRVMIHIFPGHM